MNNKTLWLFKMAFRDSRQNRKRLFLYMSAIIVGVAALVAITSFRDNLNANVSAQAKELLGADLEVEKNSPFQPELINYLDSLSTDVSYAVEFPSMALFPKNGYTGLSQITAIEGGFPYYGTFQTDPASAAQTFKTGKRALVDQDILDQIGLNVGDSVKVGFTTFVIEGGIISIPGQNVAASFFGPRIFIPKSEVESTGLVQTGSRVDYLGYYLLNPNTNLESLETELRSKRRDLDFRYDTVEERQEDIGEAITYLTNFLNLIGFIALLLGGIGVASSIYVYIRQKVSTVGVLRCLGASANQALFIYLIQATVMGFMGALVGALLGTIVQLYLPSLVEEFIPVDLDLFISWSSIASGVIIGVSIAVIFALIPLMAVRNISPLFTIRTVEIQLSKLLSKTAKTSLYGIIIASITIYAWVMLKDWRAAIFFTLALGFCMLLLLGFAKLIMKGARAFTPTSWSYEWRQGLANLYRPNNQTSTLLLTFGLGVTLISSLYLSQDLLLSTLNFENEEEVPNLALYDIQIDQNEGVNNILTENGLQLIQNVPIVTMRLQSLNGMTTSEVLADSNRNSRRWALTREYRSSYKSKLSGTEEILSGNWVSEVEGFDEIVPISVEQGLMEDLDAVLGDTLIWDVQGIPISSYIASTRSVQWDTPQPNFFVIFPKGVLENAPQFFATTVKSPGRESSLKAQQLIVQSYPNISAIDIGQVVETIRQFIDKVTFVIQFIGLFSIITGLIVLAGSASTSRFQRIKEAVLLRTLGASKRQVVKIQIIEYTLLGIMASLTGLILSVGASAILAYFYFDLNFVPNFFIIGIEILILVSLVLLIGLLNTRGMHNKPPLEILRAEGN